MTVLIVLGSILLLLLLLLLSPVYVKVSYHQELLVSVRYLFFLYRVPVEAEDVETVTEATLETDRDVSLVQQLVDVLKRNDLRTTLKMLEYLVKEMGAATKGFLRRIKLREFRFKMIVAGDDAAETAINYGYACAVAYPAFRLLFEYLPCKKKIVAVNVDFCREDMEIDVVARLRITLLFLIVLALKMFKGFLPLIRWFKGKRPKRKVKQPEKSGKART